jgi:hypothetical protein
VDLGHPQWEWIAATPSGRIYVSFFFFFFFFFSWCSGSPERETWPLRVAGSLPLVVGVDLGHPQAAGSGSRPPPVAGSMYLFFFFFSFLLVRWFAGERDMATEGGQISPPGRWGGSRPPPVAGSIFFFFGSLEMSLEVGGWRRRY